MFNGSEILTKGLNNQESEELANHQPCNNYSDILMIGKLRTRTRRKL